MAGLYETILAQAPTTPSIFGNAATTPANIDASNARIEYLRQAVANAQSALNAEKNSYNNAMSNYNKAYSNVINSPAYRYGYGYDDYHYNNGGNANSLLPTAPSYTSVSNAQSALTKANNELNEAIAMQKMQKIAGQDAVNWGQAAKTAEQQGIANAAQMYQQAMQNEAARYAIMNNAINSMGMGGGGK